MSAAPTSRPVALVTGGARRVGGAICRALARAGCDIHLTCLTSDAEARALVKELSALNARACAHKLDLSDPSAVESFVGKVLSELPRLDILVHNASAYAATPLAEVTAEQYERMHRINALSPLLLSRGLAPLLSRSPMSGGGAIVALCDIHAMGLPRAHYSAYAMSKAALAEMVRTLAIELAPSVRVNAVAPGVVAWHDDGAPHEPDAQGRARYLTRVPLGRVGTPEDAAEAVRWLAMDAKFTTGQIIRVDGGRSLR